MRRKTHGEKDRTNPLLRPGLLIDPYFLPLAYSSKIFERIMSCFFFPLLVQTHLRPLKHYSWSSTKSHSSGYSRA
jgi:hypothetical protein